MIFPNGRNRSLTRLKRFLVSAMSSWSPGAQMFNPMGSNRFRAATIRDVCMEYRSPLRFIFFLSWSETAAYGTKINIGICNNFLSQDSWAFSNCLWFSSSSFSAGPCFWKSYWGYLFSFFSIVLFLRFPSHYNSPIGIYIFFKKKKKGYYFVGVFLFLVWPHYVAWRILVPWPEIEPKPLPVEAWSPNHWTNREFLYIISEGNCTL